jgi:hypothetical protein
MRANTRKTDARRHPCRAVHQQQTVALPPPLLTELGRTTYFFGVVVLT